MIAPKRQPVARTDHEVGFVSLFSSDDDSPSRWVVAYREGGISGRKSFEAEIDARREYDRLRRSCGSMR